MVVFSSKLVLAQMGLAHCVCVDDLKRYLILLAYQYATYFHLTKIEFFFKQTLFIRFDHLVTLLHINHLALEFGHIAVHYNSSFRSGWNFYPPSLIV